MNFETRPNSQPHDPGPTKPGWYPDPWRAAAWRWWDGHQWTARVSNPNTDRQPFLPAWLSLPVAIFAVPAIPIVAILAVLNPLAAALGLVPLAIVLPTLWWLDRVEPEPLSSRLHALLWGATATAAVAFIINSFVSDNLGDIYSLVLSAPLVEEAGKGLGVYWAVKRREVDSVMDGIVYAGWVALGFAVVEDFWYFVLASGEGQLWQAFILRALLTPFVHPLFTSWIGLAIGLAVARKRPVALSALWGYALAVASHAAWNGSVAYAQETENIVALLFAALCFVVLFIVGSVIVIQTRRSQQTRFTASIPMLAERYGVSPAEASIFVHWRSMLAARRRLTRRQRRGFDEVHSALARLSFLHERPGPIDPWGRTATGRAPQSGPAESSQPLNWRAGSGDNERTAAPHIAPLSYQPDQIGKGPVVPDRYNSHELRVGRTLPSWFPCPPGSRTSVFRSRWRKTCSCGGF